MSKFPKMQPKPKPTRSARQVYDPNTNRIVRAKTDEQLARAAEVQAEWDELDEIERMPEPEPYVTKFELLARYLAFFPENQAPATWSNRGSRGDV